MLQSCASTPSRCRTRDGARRFVAARRPEPLTFLLGGKIWATLPALPLFLEDQVRLHVREARISSKALCMRILNSLPFI